MPNANTKQNNFNFLRLVFASLVLLSHAYELVDGNRNRELLTSLFGTLSFGEFAVDGFFLLSGYLIIKSWDSTPIIKLFIYKRIARIYPGFIVASVISVFIVGPFGANAGQYFSEINLPKFFTNLFVLGFPLTPPVFAGQPYPAVNGAMWTIRYEFMCYMAVLGMGLLGLVKRPVGWTLVAVALVSIVLVQRLGVDFSIAGKSISFEHPLIRLGQYFAVGGIFYIYRKKIIFDIKIVAICAAFLCLTMMSQVFVDLGLSVFGGYLLFYFAEVRFSLLKYFQRASDVSYGVYLYGWPIQKLIIWVVPDLAVPLIFLCSLGLSMLAGYLSWHLVEKRFMRNRETVVVTTPA